MKLSIIIPLYNKAPYITKALESVKAQTFTDWECIIVDDGSTDGSGRIADELAMHNAQCTVIHQDNKGVSVARNRGIAESKGEYIAFLDADDWWAPTFLEKMVQLTKDYPEAGIYASNYVYYKPGKTRVGVKTVYDAQCTMHKDNNWRGYINYPKSYYVNGGQIVWTGATIINRLKIEDCRLENGDYFQRGVKLGEDFLLWARMTMKYPVAFVNIPLAYYNNDVPATLRLTCNVHQLAANMLWHLDKLEDYRLQIASCRIEDWVKLFSKLRATGLLPYWLSDEYYNQAKQELAKVQWNLLNDWKDQKKYQRLYQLPICVVKAEQWFIRLGSAVKQRLIKVCK